MRMVRLRRDLTEDKKVGVIDWKKRKHRFFQLGTARDCYASTLQRNKVPRDDISQMLGHSNVVVTEHYLDGLDSESTYGINNSIL